jgi:hypothetical protein
MAAGARNRTGPAATDMRPWTVIASVEGVVALLAEFMGWGTPFGFGVLGFVLAGFFVPLSIWAVVRERRAAWPLIVVAIPFLLLNGLLFALISAVAGSCAHGRCP